MIGADVKTLKAALDDSNRFVRTEAVRRLGEHLEEPGVLDALMGRLSDRSTRVRDVVLEFVPLFGAGALPALETLLTQGNMQAVCRAAPAIAKMAENKPHTGQQNVANVLKKRSRNWWILPAERKMLKECAERIEWAIFHLKDMPIAAGAPTNQADLPRPSAEPTIEAKNLPIPWWQAIFRRDR